MLNTQWYKSLPKSNAFFIITCQQMLRTKSERTNEWKLLEMFVVQQMMNEYWVWRTSDECRACCSPVASARIKSPRHKAYYSNWVWWIWDRVESDAVLTLFADEFIPRFNYISLCWCDKLPFLLIEVCLCRFSLSPSLPLSFSPNFHGNFISAV